MDAKGQQRKGQFIVVLSNLVFTGLFFIKPTQAMLSCSHSRSTLVCGTRLNFKNGFVLLPAIIVMYVEN